MNYQIPVSLLSEKANKLIKLCNFSSFKLNEGEYVFLKERIFFVKRIYCKSLVLVDEEEKLYLVLTNSSFRYNPLTREIITNTL